jgi:hypothetical protein
VHEPDKHDSTLEIQMKYRKKRLSSSENGVPKVAPSTDDVTAKANTLRSHGLDEPATLAEMHLLVERAVAAREKVERRPTLQDQVRELWRWVWGLTVIVLLLAILLVVRW